MDFWNAVTTLRSQTEQVEARLMKEAGAFDACLRRAPWTGSLLPGARFLDLQLQDLVKRTIPAEKQEGEVLSQDEIQLLVRALVREPVDFFPFRQKRFDRLSRGVRQQFLISCTIESDDNPLLQSGLRRLQREADSVPTANLDIKPLTLLAAALQDPSVLEQRPIPDPIIAAALVLRGSGYSRIQHLAVAMERTGLSGRAVVYQVYDLARSYIETRAIGGIAGLIRNALAVNGVPDAVQLLTAARKASKTGASSGLLALQAMFPGGDTFSILVRHIASGADPDLGRKMALLAEEVVSHRNLVRSTLARELALGIQAGCSEQQLGAIAFLILNEAELAWA